jgi:C_GCAxxG_C_C family probable redox protein
VTATERAVRLFQGGCNCSQSILTAFGERHDIDPGLARRLGRPWGAGVGRQALTCGALSGAVLVIGLAQDDPDEGRSREQTYATVRELFRRFDERHGSTLCRGLLGHDMSTDEGRCRIEEGKLTQEICPGLVRSVGEILEDLVGSAAEREESSAPAAMLGGPPPRS